MTTCLLTDRDTPDVETCHDTLGKARKHAELHDIRRWVAKDPAGIMLANWLDPKGSDHENIEPAKTYRGERRPVPCTTGRLRVTLIVPDASGYRNHSDLTKATLAHQKLAADYLKVGAEITYVTASEGLPAPRPTESKAGQVVAEIKAARAERSTPKAVTPRRTIGTIAPKTPAPTSKRRANELHGDFAARRAVETGRPWYLSRPAFGTWRVTDRAPEGRGWTAYLPEGTTIASQYGRSSKKGRERLLDVRNALGSWQREQAAQAIGSPVTVDGTPVTPAPATSSATPPATPRAPVEQPSTPTEPVCDDPGANAAPIPPVVWAAPTSAPVFAIDVPMLPTGGPVAPAAPALPPAMVDYLARLLNPAKRAYAAELAEHLCSGTPAPVAPSTDWAADVARKVARYIQVKEMSS